VKTEDQKWQRLLEARKAGGVQANDDADLTPPPGFATRIAAQVSAARHSEALKLWRRWSFYGAVGSACVLVLALAYSALTPDAGSLLPIPTFELPDRP